MNDHDPSFMYSQLLKEILLEMQDDEKARREFVRVLRIQYAENTVALRSIDDFEQEYDKPSPIWWYTKESFIYSALNKALRTEDIEIILKMGFIVRDLCRQIEQVYSDTRQETKQIVYRGQGMSSVDFEKIKKNEGGLRTFNYFLSTSTNQQVANAFAESVRNDSDLIGILFQMEIDSSISSSQFALLNGISYYSGENEILFSMHTVFRICNILKLDDRLWQINLRLTNDDDEQLKNLTEYIRQEFEGVAENHRLGTLMRRMDKLEKAEEIFTQQLESASNKSSLAIADLHSELGGIKYSQGDASNALAHFEKALEIKEKTLLSTDPDLAKAYSSVGTAYCSIGKYLTALSYHKKALGIREEVLSPIHPDLGVAYNNLGAVYDAMGNYSAALSYYKKAINIKEKILPSLHPTLAITHSNIGRLYKVMEDYPTALLSYKKTLEIEQKSLPPTHSSLGTTYNNIAGVHQSSGDYSNALMCLEKALKIQQESLSSTHPNLGMTYNNIGVVYISMKDYSVALSHLEKALEIQQKSLPPIHPLLAKTYSNMGRMYTSMGNNSIALSYYEKALGIQQKSLQYSHPDVALTYNKLGNVLYSLGRYEEAVIHAERAVVIALDTLGCDHPIFRTYQEDVKQFRQKL
ncbi:unnamed protein product [Didymodactylos carnosus]|uniref:NAD(P)(+)--arginine ADP-ribosyltransferase n=1 Tax=Didymodactylos carnosus TaxID=1234261 RepID=A0A814KR74_9BILA|nr:unnamed protein product [Didymodactylos carnosus]CAF3824130.1 unnamed protein product [Didymodactylos carnosus]